MHCVTRPAKQKASDHLAIFVSDEERKIVESNEKSGRAKKPNKDDSSESSDSDCEKSIMFMEEAIPRKGKLIPTKKKANPKIAKKTSVKKSSVNLKNFFTRVEKDNSEILSKGIEDQENDDTSSLSDTDVEHTLNQRLKNLGSDPIIEDTVIEIASDNEEEFDVNINNE